MEHPSIIKKFQFYLYTIIIIACVNNSSILAQMQSGTIDTVFSFKPGKGQNSGQSELHFPKNIFGLPDTNASDYFQASSEEQVCSLGLGGEIIVGFKNRIITEGDGFDFTIFENAFINPATQKVFAEPAVVAVSQDGINYIEFPYNFETLAGCAGTIPTNGKYNPFNPDESGGNSFDLSEIGLKWASYIKITDITEKLLENPSHQYYDPILSGFDLDAIVGLHLSEQFNSKQEKSSTDIDFKIIINDEFLSISSTMPDESHKILTIYSITGKKVFTRLFTNYTFIDLTGTAAGLYIMTLRYSNKFISKKIILY